MLYFLEIEVKLYTRFNIAQSFAVFLRKMGNPCDQQRDLLRTAYDIISSKRKQQQQSACRQTSDVYHRPPTKRGETGRNLETKGRSMYPISMWTKCTSQAGP